MKQNATPDSSFWINAHRSGLLPYVLERYDLHYTPAVGMELKERFPSGREFWRLVRKGVVAEAIPEIEEVHDFGPGERAAINLALTHPDWILLIDDRRPFIYAERLGVKVLCTPVLVVELHSESKLDIGQALNILARLAAMQTVSKELINASLIHLGRRWKGQGGK